MQVSGEARKAQRMIDELPGGLISKGYAERRDYFRGLTISASDLICKIGHVPAVRR